MKITQVTPYFYPHVGGVESHVLSLSRELAKIGHEVKIVTSLVKNSQPHENFEQLEIFRVKPLLNAYNTPVMPNLSELLNKMDSDILHTHTPPPFTSYYAAKISKKKNIPLVLTYHCDLEIPGIFGGFIVGIYRRTFEPYTLKQTDNIIVHTKTYGSTSRAIWRFAPAIIPSAVDALLFHPNVSGERIRESYDLSSFNVVLYVGRLRHHKGLEYMIESAKYTPENVKYLIVGGGDFEIYLKNLAKKIGVSNKIIFTGEIPNEKLPEYYAACDVFLLPSVSRLEAFGLVILEAMASGKPVIVSDIPGVREVIENNVEGLLAEPLNSKDIAEKIKFLIADKELREKMGKNGRKKVEEKYQISTIARQVEKVYRDVLSGR
jgi:glycosyltransferase involved in cell wall biosynthesis